MKRRTKAGTLSREAVGRLVRRLGELGAVSEEPGRLTRTFLSEAMGRANRLVGGWMAEAGLTVREDAVGNLIGRLEAAEAGPAGARPGTLLLGSHLDTVRDAGRYDGALGVLLALGALEEVRARGLGLPFAVEVLGFSEEEGVRFGSAYLGSKGYAGLLRPVDLARRDGAGLSVRQVLDGRARERGSPASLRRSAPRRGSLLGYVEAHIEQGPVLESRGLALGVVSAIAGQTRGWAGFGGRAGHAGTTPMGLRRDALAGAAEWVLAVEALGRSEPALVATVGRMEVSPGAANVIAAAARLTLDVRHPDDGRRRSALAALLAAAGRIARRRRLAFTWQVTQDDDAVPCAPELTARLARSVRRVQGRCPALVSGAGHDAVVMASLVPVALLFVRCREGLSHHPREFASAADAGMAQRVLVDFLLDLARGGRAAPPP